MSMKSDLYREYMNDNYDPDLDDINEQPRCRCGRFQGHAPNREWERVVGVIDEQTYDEDGLELTYTLKGEYVQSFIGRVCQCGYTLWEGENGKEKLVTFDPPKVGDWMPVEDKPGCRQVVWREESSL